MGIFSGFLGKGSDSPLDVGEAVMVPMVAAALVDGDVADEEVGQLRSICVWSPIFARNTVDQDTQIIRRAVRLIDDLGSQAACERARDALSPALRETAFIFAVRLVFSDAHVGAKERAFVEQLVSWLGLEEARARMLTEAVSIMQHTAAA